MRLKRFTHLLLPAALCACFLGCSTGGEAEFEETEAMTQEDLDYAEEYEKQQAENQKRMRSGG